jgi:phosphatidylglycerophosphate synthase
MRIPTSLALLVVYDPRSLTRSWICLALVLLVMATDYLDGMIARKYSVQTKFGYLLDGLGDRAFHVSVFLILVTSGILAILLAWVMIFREISQYAVRLVELDWYSSQSKIDRRITRIYAAAVQGISLIEVSRAIIAPSTLPVVYIVLINATLAIVATMSFSRIIPRLILAWRIAIDG